MVQMSQRKDNQAASEGALTNSTQPTEHHPRMLIVVETNYQVIYNNRSLCSNMFAQETDRYILQHTCKNVLLHQLLCALNSQ
jgi:hypothetical protein